MEKQKPGRAFSSPSVDSTLYNLYQSGDIAAFLIYIVFI
jgi:hypothetical protein